MDDRQLNPLHTGVLFVALGQIMDSGIMKLPHCRDHLSRLRADVGIDECESTSPPVARRTWSWSRQTPRALSWLSMRNVRVGVKLRRLGATGTRRLLTQQRTSRTKMRLRDCSRSTRRGAAAG
jgi:hypothetical protein